MKNKKNNNSSCWETYVSGLGGKQEKNFKVAVELLTV